VQFDIIYHFAAQAGVRYTVVDPNSYLHSNVKAFKNFCKFIKIKKPKKFIFASSSSVYGDMKTYPVKESNKLKPKNLYAETKKFNELYVEKYFNKSKIKCIGLRLFTIYGEWGRPDMLIFKFLKMAENKLTFNLNNNGNMYRDFTYIDSVTRILIKLINFESQKKFIVFNICSSKPIKISYVIKKLVKITNYKNINYIPMNKLEVFKTYGDNNKIFKMLKLNKKFLNFDIGLKKTFNWYKKNKKII
jgi:UDP-glucuronate 4-epimerase